MMPGVTQRVAPEGAHLSARTRQNALLTPEEIAAARRARQEADNPALSTPGLSVSELEVTPALPSIAAAPAAPLAAAPSVLPASPPAVLGAHAIAEMCAEAGVPELTLSLLQQPMTLKQVESRLESAKLVMQCGNLLGLPVMGRQLMLAGVSVDAARKMMNEAQVQADAAIITDPTFSGAPPQADRGRINSAGVYARLNARMSKGGNAG